MAEYKVVPSEDEGYFMVDGLYQPLTKMSVVFNCDFDPADTDVEKLDKMTSSIYDVRHQYGKQVKDSDTFETPYGKLVVRGNLVVSDDGTGSQTQASTAQANVPTPNQTLGQVCAQMGIVLPPQLQPMASTPVGQIPWGTIAVPPHMKPLFAPPVQQAVQSAQANNVQPPWLGSAPAQPHTQQNPAGLSLGQLHSPNKSTYGSFLAVDQNGHSVSGQLAVSPTDTNQSIVDEFDIHINNAFGNGNLRSVIVFPTGKRVLEVLYANDTFKVILELT